MASRKPLVLVNGEPQQLQAGDDMLVPISGVNELSAVNDNAGAVVIGMPVYIAAAGHIDKAKADASGTSKVLGLVTSTSIAGSASGTVGFDGVMSATTAQWDAVTGDTGGLTAGSYYFLDAATAGKITKTAPSAAGQYVVKIGLAVSTTDMKLILADRILL